jgi:hypothetical protein
MAGPAPVIDHAGVPITLTGYGYLAGPGYDLTTGLGSPNGTLLARAMTAIAHSQMSFGTSPDMLDADGAGGWLSGADQSLMFQAMSAVGAGATRYRHEPASCERRVGHLRVDQPAGTAGAAVGLRSHLVRLFDKQAQGWVGQSVVGRGAPVGVDRWPVDRWRCRRR